MEIDIMIRKLHELLAFKDKYEPLLKEAAEAKAAHEQKLALNATNPYTNEAAK